MSSSLKNILRRANMPFVAGRAGSRGLTLVELLVAMAVSLLVILAAGAALLAGRRGAETVDVAGQLRDNGRFASEIIQRLVVQTGFEDLESAGQPYANSPMSFVTQNEGVPPIEALRPNLQGYNNATPSSTDPLNAANLNATGAAIP